VSTSWSAAYGEHVPWVILSLEVCITLIDATFHAAHTNSCPLWPIWREVRASKSRLTLLRSGCLSHRRRLEQRAERVERFFDIRE
jgi:hypothetical protein